jgi:peptidoglycan hydrolase-like protein with peptidoglycan-binding domain
MRAGWRGRFGVEPRLETVALCLAVAEHETRCGDAWPGEFNYGAVQDSDKVAQATLRDCLRKEGLAAHPSRVAEAKAILNRYGYRTDGLHVDSSPGKGYYWVYFRTFADDEQGASYFVKIIAVDRPSCKGELETGNAYGLAAAMYRTHYYEGFYKPGHHYERQASGKWTEVPSKTSSSWTGEELNISAYASALQRLVPTITAALAGPRTLRRGDRGEDVKAVQRVVGVEDDGIFGRKTEAAVILWQQSNHLTADGIVGPLTRAAMESP